jgi:hypothetical protein
MASLRRTPVARPSGAELVRQMALAVYPEAKVEVSDTRRASVSRA